MTASATPSARGPGDEQLPRGHSRRKLYSVWRAMLSRCQDRGCPTYRFYGGRGIEVCPEWLGPGGFRAFAKDVGLPRFPGATLDRVDNDGHYSRENFRWADRKTQMRNTRGNRLLTFQGRTMTLVEWAERLGIKAVTLGQRLLRGWSVEKALTRPVERRKPYSQWRPREKPRRPPAPKPRGAAGESRDTESPLVGDIR